MQMTRAQVLRTEKVLGQIGCLELGKWKTKDVVCPFFGHATLEHDKEVFDYSANRRLVVNKDYTWHILAKAHALVCESWNRLGVVC